MTTLTASQARIPRETYNQVCYQGQPVEITRHDDERVFLISKSDFEALQQHKDRVRSAAQKVFEKHGEALARLAK